MPTKAKPLSYVDAAWLGMEDPTNLMMVTGILTFDKMLDIDHFKTILSHRLLSFDRFRQRVVQPQIPLGTAYWELDPHFDLDAHIHRIALPSPGDQNALQDLASDLLSTPLDFSKPLWQAHIVENVGDGCALIIRLHHCIGDGMALISVLLSLTDFTSDAPAPQGDPAYLEQHAAGPGGLVNTLFDRATSRLDNARRLSRRFVREGLEAMLFPGKMLDLTLQGADNAVAASRLVLRSPDPKTIFKGDLGVSKRGAWSRPLPLTEIKAIKNLTGSTVNDVLISAMTGGLRRYLLSREQPVEGLNFRTAVPVNLRSEEEMGTLGNKFGIVFLSLPVGIGDPLARLKEVRTRMNALKNTPEAIAALGILNVIGMSPQDIQTLIVEMFGAKTTAVMTNVPGPPVPLYLAGRKIDSIMFWVPQSGRVGLGISIISYAGKVWLGVATDAGLVPDPDLIVDGFYEEYEALMALVKQSETTAEVTAHPQKQAPVRCRAKTKAGNRCRNSARDGSHFCHVHQVVAGPL
jgi:WS/DGAT/MGAT family acyltransferase